MKGMLKLQELKVQSFITKINQSNNVLGGQTGLNKCREEGDILSPGNTITLGNTQGSNCTEEIGCVRILVVTEGGC